MSRRENGRPVFVYRVNLSSGPHDAVSVMEPEWVARHGLHTEAVLGVFHRPQGTEDEVSPDTFEENPEFVRFLQELIADHLSEVQQVIHSATANPKGAYIYLVDGRTTRQGGEVQLQDVLGMARVVAGRPVPGSYQPHPAHRLYTSDGFFLLPPELEPILRREIIARVGG